MAAGSRLNRCLVELTQECQDLLEELQLWSFPAPKHTHVGAVCSFFMSFGTKENKRLDKEVQELSAKLCAPRESRKELRAFRVLAMLLST